MALLGLSGLIADALPRPDNDITSGLMTESAAIAGYLLMLLFVLAVTTAARVRWRLLIGNRPDRVDIRTALVAVIPLIGLSFASMYALYLPLSYVFPDFVTSILRHEDRVLWGGGIGIVVTALVFVNGGVLAPVVEETLFRGVVLSRWTSKWTLRRGVIMSSLAFGVLHVDLLGAVAFGYVAAVLYVRSRSLAVPILLHVVNNVTALTATAIDQWVSTEPYTLAGFRSEWWQGAVGLAIGLPWLLWFVRRHGLRPGDQLPYDAGHRRLQDPRGSHPTP